MYKKNVLSLSHTQIRFTCLESRLCSDFCWKTCDAKFCFLFENIMKHNRLTNRDLYFLADLALPIDLLEKRIWNCKQISTQNTQLRRMLNYFCMHFKNFCTDPANINKFQLRNLETSDSFEVHKCSLKNKRCNCNSTKVIQKAWVVQQVKFICS